MATCIDRLQLMVGGELTTVKVAELGQLDGIIWHTAGPEMGEGGVGHEGNPGGGLGHEGNPGGGLGHEGNPGGGLGHEGNPGGGLGHEGNAGGGTGHDLRVRIEQYALGDDAVGPDGAAPSMEVLLARLAPSGR